MKNLFTVRRSFLVVLLFIFHLVSLLLPWYDVVKGVQGFSGTAVLADKPMLTLALVVTFILTSFIKTKNQKLNFYLNVISLIALITFPVIEIAVFASCFDYVAYGFYVSMVLIFSAICIKLFSIIQNKRANS